MIVRSLRYLTAGVIFAFATGAHAQGNLPNPWYVAFGAGATWYNNFDLDGVGRIDLDNPGYSLNGAFGRYIDDIRVIRLEGEVVYTSAAVDNFSGAAASGDLLNVGLMFNAIYDFRTGTPWTPYLGGGLGYSRVELDSFSSGGLSINDDAGAFAYQFKAGVAYELSPTWVVNIGYRLYGTDSVSLTDSTGTGIGTDGTLTQSAEVGFRFHF